MKVEDAVITTKSDTLVAAYRNSDGNIDRVAIYSDPDGDSHTHTYGIPHTDNTITVTRTIYRHAHCDGGVPHFHSKHDAHDEADPPNFL